MMVLTTADVIARYVFNNPTMWADEMASYLLIAIVFLGLWFAVQFLNGINQLPIFERNAVTGGVAFWAHVMGFVAGLLLVVVMKRPERAKVEWWDGVRG